MHKADERTGQANEIAHKKNKEKAVDGNGHHEKGQWLPVKKIGAHGGIASTSNTKNSSGTILGMERGY